MQAAVELSVQRLELVPDLLLGPAGDLAPEPLPIRPEAKRDRPDVPVRARSSMLGLANGPRPIRWEK
jgi:hypothetical protein